MCMLSMSSGEDLSKVCMYTFSFSCNFMLKFFARTFDSKPFRNLGNLSKLLIMTDFSWLIFFLYATAC